MQLTVLSPGREQLQALRTEWQKTMGAAAGDRDVALKELTVRTRYKDVLGRRAGPDIDLLADSETPLDRSAPNGSSIAVLAEFHGNSCLFAADCHPDVLERSIDRLLRARRSERLRIDVLKVAHHGSKYNNTSSLLQKLNCPMYLISTSGQIFHHPDPECIARIIKYGGPGVQLYFNYDTERTRLWDDAELKRRYHYEVTTRPGNDPALEISM
jgi:hypothetical protein